MAYDLTLEAPRGILLSVAAMQKLEEALRQETKLDYLCELTMHFGGRRPRGDWQELLKYFEDGDFKRDEFEEFCHLHNLAPDWNDEAAADSAARLFKDLKWGQAIITADVSDPRDCEDIRKAYRLMVEFARRHSLWIQDPQIGEYIDLENPGEFPPMMYDYPHSPKRRWLSFFRGS